MPSFSRRADSGATRLLTYVVIAALAVTVRLPFLLRGDRIFDSDEAVEGLMARHVLQGELPIFLWGQHYKGVPEVYLTSAVFAAAGSSVIALKATTLALFALFACVQFRLLTVLLSRRIAWMATALAIVGPPSLVLWTLSANAEIVLTLLAGTVMGLALLRWEQSRSPLAIGVAAAAVGFGLWVHQYIVFYVVSLAVTLLATRADARAYARDVLAARGAPAVLRFFTWGIAAIGLAYIAIGVASFLVGGFDVTVFDVFVSLHSPQKLWRIGGMVLALAVVLRAVAYAMTVDGRASRVPGLAVMAGAVAGYAPALVDHFRWGVHMPMSRMDLGGLGGAAATIGGVVTPMLLGFRSPLTDWLPVSPWLVLVLVVALAASVVGVFTRGLTPFFHIFLVVAPVLFLVSGSFIDAQSYRYLMPVFAAVPVVLAIGADEIWRRSAPAGVAVLVATLAVFATQQTVWYARLQPDARAQAALACLRDHEVRGTSADYWLSYKVTFLSNESVILAPNTAVDRYPPYTAFVRSLPSREADEACRPLLLQ